MKSRIESLPVSQTLKDKASEIVNKLPRNPDLINPTNESIIFEWFFSIEDSKYIMLEIYEDTVVYLLKFKDYRYVTEIDAVEDLIEDLEWMY